MIVLVFINEDNYGNGQKKNKFKAVDKLSKYNMEI
jgi:hypothetical protein